MQIFAIGGTRAFLDLLRGSLESVLGGPSAFELTTFDSPFLPFTGDFLRHALPDVIIVWPVQRSTGGMDTAKNVLAATVGMQTIVVGVYDDEIAGAGISQWDNAPADKRFDTADVTYEGSRASMIRAFAAHCGMPAGF